MASNAVSVAAAPQIKHDVFINFRGEDTRNTFTSHLLAALERNGIDAFTEKGLNGGEEISTTLSGKISESRASVVVFSQNYADSRWCLDELVQIMLRKEVNGQTVLPVFLQGVEPTHVRNQTGAFGDAFGRLLLDSRFAYKVQSWRRALKQAADLSGWSSDQLCEGEIVEKILSRIQSVLSQMSSDDSYTYFVGNDRVENVESFLSSSKITSLGIWGMGGSGKTILAKKIYNCIYKNFEGVCFIANVKESIERYGLNSLRGYLLSQLLGVHECHPISFCGNIQRKLQRTRVLVVLDDIRDASQLLELIGNQSFYCPESKIIATSRDKQVLKNVCDKVYEVQKLNDYESLQLLQFHILKRRWPTQEQMELLKKAIKYTQGLPLALVVLGRNLFDKDITIWKSELAKLSDVPDLEIMKILRTSFDGLEDSEKNIFLDIACLLQGWNKDLVESILEACGYYAIRGIARLVDKALITISNRTIWMHDLVRQMGQHIALHGSVKEIGTPSRLWRNKEIINLLTKNQWTEGMDKIEILSMDLSKVAASIKLKSKVFKRMTSLRILQFHNDSSKSIIISLPKGLKYLPNSLRYLQWDLYPLPSLPSRFNPENLVALHVVGSHLRQLWTCKVEPCLPNLKYVKLSCSKDLTTFPNFKNASKMEALLAPFCDSLKDIPDSIEHLVELKEIDLCYSTSLERFPKASKLTKLERLSLDGCSKIRHIPPLPQNLISLNLSTTKIKELPSSIQRMSQLEALRLVGCVELERLPDNISQLKNLKHLDLSKCPKLLSLPADLGDLKRLMTLGIKQSPLHSLPSLKSLVLLRYMSVCGSNLKSLPEDIKYLTNLWSINLSCCKSLSLIPQLPPSLRKLNASNCTSLKKYTHVSTREDVRLNFCERICLRWMFGNCFNLEQDARNQILRDLWLRVPFTPLPSVEELSYRPRPSADFCFPGNEVPEWFKYSQIASSLQVKTKFRRRLHPLRFIFCAVVDLPPKPNPRWKRLDVGCKCLTKSGEYFYSTCDYIFEDETFQFQTSHTILWCEYFGHSQFYFNEATFQFSARLHFCGGDVAIAKCGVTPVGITFGTSWGLPVVIHDSNSSGASLLKRLEKSKSAIDDDNDEEEPPLKRCKLGDDQQQGTEYSYKFDGYREADTVSLTQALLGLRLP